MPGVKRDLCSVILNSYIGLVWSCRNENGDFIYMKIRLLAKIRYNVRTILLCPGIKNEIKEMFNELDTKYLV